MKIIRPAYAQGIANRNGVATIAGFEGLFARILRYAYAFAAIALFIMLLVGGFKYITSGGDPKAAESAKKTITAAIAGLVLVGTSILILRLISQFTGADVLNFRVFIP